MPIYTYKCTSCEQTEDLVRKMEDRNQTVYHHCQTVPQLMDRCVELSGPPEIFLPYYDEGLGCDVQSKSDHKAIMKALDVVEVGDKVHGARNFDEKAENVIGKQDPKGVRLKERPDVIQTVQTVDGDGDIQDSSPFQELSDADSAPKIDDAELFDKAWNETIAENPWEWERAKRGEVRTTD